MQLTINRIDTRYVLDNEGGGFNITDVSDNDFGLLVPGSGRTCLEDPR